MKMTKAGELSSRGAKDTLALMFKDGGEPKAIAEAAGLIQKSDAGALKKIAEEVIAANERVIAEYKAGKEASLQFLVGQGMKASKGSANPGVLAKTFKELLG
jgi:aspartyl-tRNA(Asn)/glutamyl-tRNA(Gln) amidotransferase subunit B